MTRSTRSGTRHVRNISHCHPRSPREHCTAGLHRPCSSWGPSCSSGWPVEARDGRSSLTLSASIQPLSHGPAYSVGAGTRCGPTVQRFGLHRRLRAKSEPVAYEHDLAPCKLVDLAKPCVRATLHGDDVCLGTDDTAFAGCRHPRRENRVSGSARSTVSGPPERRRCKRDMRHPRGISRSGQASSGDKPRAAPCVAVLDIPRMSSGFCPLQTKLAALRASVESEAVPGIWRDTSVRAQTKTPQEVRSS